MKGKIIAIIILFSTVIRISFGQSPNIFYTNDNAVFESKDNRIELRRFVLDSTNEYGSNKYDALFRCKIVDDNFLGGKSFSNIFIPQTRNNYHVIGNALDIELDEGNYDILLYDITGNAIYHNLFVTKKKTYVGTYKMGSNSIVCRNSAFMTDTFRIKYQGEPVFFYNDTDTVCFSGSILEEMVINNSLPIETGCLSLNIYKRNNKSTQLESNRINAKVFIPDLLLEEDITLDRNTIILKEGFYNLFVIADGFFPYNLKIDIQKGIVYKINVFMGFVTFDIPALTTDE